MAMPIAKVPSYRAKDDVAGKAMVLEPGSAWHPRMFGPVLSAAYWSVFQSQPRRRRLDSLGLLNRGLAQRQKVNRQTETSKTLQGPLPPDRLALKGAKSLRHRCATVPY